MSEFNSNEEKNTICDEKMPKEDPVDVESDTSNGINTDKEDKTDSKSSDISENTAQEESPSQREKRLKRLITITDYIELAVIAVITVILLFSFCFKLCSVNGPSMNNTLIHGDKVIISDLFYTPKRNDIVVFHDTNTLNEPVVKRVIATEGETVDISYTDNSMTVTVTDKDGKTTVLEEPYVIYEFQSYVSGTYVVPEDHVFVMGDNRSHSMDSRHIDIGFVDERSILGRVLFRVTPFSKFGAVK